jgi:hypothetical protein
LNIAMRLNKFFVIFIVNSFLFSFIYLISIVNDFPKFYGVREDKICGRYPTEAQITVDNLFWQILELPKGFVNILNAYVDQRQNKSVVRVNVISFEFNVNETNVIHCQMWFGEEKSPKIVRVSEVLLIWSEFGRNEAEVEIQSFVPQFLVLETTW